MANEIDLILKNLSSTAQSLEKVTAHLISIADHLSKIDQKALTKVEEEISASPQKERKRYEDL
ncbi:hypothetical protein L4H30_002491 [Pseudomonas aeruginosa]|nr:hypothetical protein [Pseudomonas aeruginosa]